MFIKVSEESTFIFMAIPLVIAIGAAPIWVMLGEKWGKKKAYIVAAVYLSLSFLLCLVVPEGGVLFMIALCVLAGVGISASQVIPFSIIPDVIEIDEYENGTRREGAFYGITMFLYKVASAVAINIVTIILAIFGYEEVSSGTSQVQPESAIFAIRLVMGIGPGIFFLISAIFVKMLPIYKGTF